MDRLMRIKSSSLTKLKELNGGEKLRVNLFSRGLDMLHWDFSESGGD